jgi:hypothetical protein
MNHLGGNRISKIMIIENHEEQFRISRLGGIKLYSDFERVLKENGYELKSFKKGSITNSDLKGYDIAIIGLGVNNIHPAEIQTLQDFVAEGGGLFIIGGVNYSPPMGKSYNIDQLNRMTQQFGIICEDKPIEAGKNHMKETTTLIRERHIRSVPLITKFTPHPIVGGISELIYWGVPLKTTKEVQAIAVSDEDTTPPSCIVLAAVEYGKGKVIAVGSPNLFLRMSLMKISMPFGMAKPDHVILAVNIVNWLSQ